MQIIDLASDTKTKPSKEMKKAMYDAEVGDDCYGEDTATKELEKYCADFFGKEAALFMPSGTMSNRAALNSMAAPGEEVITEVGYHINFFESSQLAKDGLVINPVFSKDGILRLDDVKKAVASKFRGDLYAKPKVISLESPIDTYSGKIYPYDELVRIRKYADKNDLKVFMDGARVLNAAAALNELPEAYAKKIAGKADALSMCFSKGLRAPFGSILVGNKEVIAKAHKLRKQLGGGAHQSGYMAAAALYAIKNHTGQLKTDNENAQLLEKELHKKNPYIEPVGSVDTNMVMFSVAKLGVSAKDFVERAAKEGVKLFPWTDNVVRAVTSSNVDDKTVVEAASRIRKLSLDMALEGFKKKLSNENVVTGQMLAVVSQKRKQK